MNNWVHRQLAGSDICVIINYMTNVVRALEGGSIFIYQACKAEGLAEGTKDTVPIGNGMYWTYSETSNRTTLTLHGRDGGVKGKIHLFACENSVVEISYNDESGDEVIESGLADTALRNRLNELTNVLTSVLV